MLYRLGYEAGRYVSMERLIELSKERYYETLEKSSVSWHDGRHDIWPYVEYLLFTIDELYQGFQQRFLQLATRRGEKTTNVIEALNAKEGEFTIRQIEFECPGVSRETIKAVLKKNSGCFVCTGHGVSARWRRIRKIGQKS